MREIDRTKALSKEDAQYLSDRGLLSAEEEAEHGIKPIPNGGANVPLDEVENTGDVNTSDGAPLVGGSPAPEASASTDGDDLTAESSKDLLQSEAEARGLSKSGTKQEIFDRIVEHDSAQTAEG